MSSAPTVGLGLPVYNGERYLRAAIASVLAQSYEDFELVICDNASRDATAAICLEAAARDPRVRYQRNAQNLGAAANFRRAYARSRGRYFKWVVYDDLLEPTYLERCVEAIEAAPPRCLLVYPKTIIIDENDLEIEHHEDRLDIRDATPHERIRRFLLNVRYCHPSLGLFRRAALRHTRIEDGFESADLVVLMELLCHGEIWEIPEYLYRRRLHGTSSMKTKKPEDLAAWLDPNNSGKLILPRTTFFYELGRSLARAQISPAERARCLYTVARTWGPAFWPELRAEMQVLGNKIAAGS